MEPFYTTDLGSAYKADSLELMKTFPDSSVNLVFTSPPYALNLKKEYGNVSHVEYVEWFLDFAKEIKRLLTDDGSFVLNIGGGWTPKLPTRSLYQYKLLIALVEELGFNLAQETFWYNTTKLPAPTEWVSVRRIRIKDSVEYVWWLSKMPWPKADNRKVLRPYTKHMIEQNKRGVKVTTRPSGHDIKTSFADISAGGSIPPNVIEGEIPDALLKIPNSTSNDIYLRKCKEHGVVVHPARFPSALPEFFIKMLTDEQDMVLDPFSGSNTTGFVAEKLNRKWISIEMNEEYLEGSKFRFDSEKK